MSLPGIKDFQQSSKIESFHKKLNGDDAAAPLNNEQNEQKEQNKPRKKSVSFSFASAKTKKELMAMYLSAVKKAPKKKDALLEAYLQRLLEINNK